jgi:hypothetical protein
MDDSPRRVTPLASCFASGVPSRAIGGVVRGVLAVGAGLIGAGFGSGFLLRQAVIGGTTTLLAAGSATGSLALARVANEPALSEAETRMQLGS